MTDVYPVCSDCGLRPAVAIGQISLRFFCEKCRLRSFGGHNDLSLDVARPRLQSPRGQELFKKVALKTLIT